MFKVGNKVCAVVLSGALVLTTGCSFSFNFGGPKPNTVEPDKIFETAKKEIFENLKVSVKKNLEKYEEDYMKVFTDWSNGGESKITFNVDAGDNGKAEVEIAIDSEMDTANVKKLTTSSTLLDLIKAPRGKGNYEVKIKADVPPLREVSGTVKFALVIDGGVYYAKLDDVQVSEDLPGIMTKEDLDTVIGSVKGQWYKLDIGQLVEGNEMLSKLVEQKIGDLNNVDAEKLSKLVESYIDDVVMKDSWMEIKKDSKEETDLGDKYQVTLPAEKSRKLLEVSYDFFGDNIEVLDAVFDITQSKNPLFGSPVATLEELREGLKTEKESFMKEMESGITEDVSFNVTFAGDKLVVFGFEFQIPEKADAEGKIMIALNFEDEKHDLEYGNVDLNFDVKGKDDQGYLKGTMKLNEADGGNRVSRGDIELSPEKGIVMKAKFDSVVEKESMTVEDFNLNFDMQSEEELGENFKGFTSELKYVGGEDKTIKGFAKSVPEAKFFDVTLDGEFGEDEGNGKIEFMMVPDGDLTVKGGAGVEYKLATKDVDFELPGEVSDAQDFTPVFVQMLAGGLGGAGLGEESGVPAEVMMGDQPDYSSMSDEEIQKVMLDSGYGAQ